MSEDEALSPLLGVKDKISNRKIRLFACGCCRRTWEWLDAQSQQLILLGERLADGTATNVERRLASKEASRAIGSYPPSHPANYAFCGITSPAFHGAFLAIVHLPSLVTAISTLRASGDIRNSKKFRIEQEYQQQLLQDIAGHVFQPVVFDAKWRSPRVIELAQGMYGSRDFGAMPILADALQDAGCNSDDILTHCRGDGPHVRGCWVVDLVLGKE